ncbi:MAG: MmcQ/YjbR family DNA-binding protein [Muribaculaceae bacterium]|nr:MmcQ/YjbR family DNA-binding protein [Muribaculaceae bacterium]
MNVEEVYGFCKSLPHAEETFPFDQINLVFKIGGKMFALLPLDKPRLIIVKCDPQLAIELRERYTGIEAAWHFNKKHWNQIDLTSDVPVAVIEQSIRHSYDLVHAKLPRAIRQSLNDISTTHSDDV